MKYVYCLAMCDPCIEHLLPPGLDGAVVRQILFGGVTVLISDLDSDRSGVNILNVLAHQKVVDAALGISKSLIPCRFGTLFPEDNSVLSLLKERYGVIRDQLARLEGKVEVSIQAIFDREVIPSGSSFSERKAENRGVKNLEQENTVVEERRKPMTAGMMYLLRRKEQFDVIEALNEEADLFNQKLNQAVSPFWLDVRTQKRLVEKKLLLNVCYLVDQRDVPSFKLAYEKFKGENSGPKLLYTGPWPPYSFAYVDFSRDSPPIRKPVFYTDLIQLISSFGLVLNHQK